MTIIFSGWPFWSSPFQLVMPRLVAWAWGLEAGAVINIRAYLHWKIGTVPTNEMMVTTTTLSDLAVHQVNLTGPAQGVQRWNIWWCPRETAKNLTAKCYPTTTAQILTTLSAPGGPLAYVGLLSKDEHNKPKRKNTHLDGFCMLTCRQFLPPGFSSDKAGWLVAEKKKQGVIMTKIWRLA